MHGEWIRRPKVAGYYYPADRNELESELDRLTPAQDAARPSIAAIVPHGGYHLSGSVTGRTLGGVAIPSRCIILAPNHAGYGAAWSLMAEGAYHTPLGEVPVDRNLACAILKACPLLSSDASAHLAEHAIETTLPFLQRRGPPDLHIVPLVIDADAWETGRSVGHALAHALRLTNTPALIIASAELTHYESREIVCEKDQRLLAAVQALDASRLWAEQAALQNRMCGAGPIACALEAAKLLGASQSRLIDYRTSADFGGDPDSAIGYAGVLVN